MTEVYKYKCPKAYKIAFAMYIATIFLFIYLLTMSKMRTPSNVIIFSLFILLISYVAYTCGTIIYRSRAITSLILTQKAIIIPYDGTDAEIIMFLRDLVSIREEKNKTVLGRRTRNIYLEGVQEGSEYHFHIQEEWMQKEAYAELRERLLHHTNMAEE